MTQLTENFTLAELTVTGTGLRNNCSNSELENIKRLATVLQTIRDALGKPLVISSAFRNAAVNKRVGGSSTSAHMKGLAADITVKGMSSTTLAREISGIVSAFDQIILEFPGEASSWVHLGIGPGNRRELLIASKRLGKTMYSPVKEF